MSRQTGESDQTEILLLPESLLMICFDASLAPKGSLIDELAKFARSGGDESQGIGPL